MTEDQAPSDDPVTPTDANQALPGAGWFPDGSGQQRWWDGNAWTDNVMTAAPATTGSSADPKTIAALIHVSTLIFGFIGPLAGYLAFPQDAFVREHSKNALNFQLTVLIGVVISFVLMFVIIGFFTLLAIALGAFITTILAAIAASRGETYQYPLTIKFLKS